MIDSFLTGKSRQNCGTKPSKQTCSFDGYKPSKRCLHTRLLRVRKNPSELWNTAVSFFNSNISNSVVERWLLLIKKYIDRTRFLPEKVFPIIPPSSSRFSQRLRVIQNRHNCILELRRKHRNKLEDSLCASQMRRLWNSLDDVTIALGFDEYKRKIQSVEQFSCSCERGLIDVVCV
jgi:hypothetical protein